MHAGCWAGTRPGCIAGTGGDSYTFVSLGANSAVLIGEGTDLFSLLAVFADRKVIYSDRKMNFLVRR